MSEKPQETTGISSSERLNELIPQLSPNQLRFVVARQDCTSDKEAAESVGLSADTVYRWNGIVKDVVKLMAEDITSAAAAIRKRNIAKAMMVKVAALDDSDAHVRQKAATEIIEWEMGKANQPVTGKDGGALEVNLTSDLMAEAAQRAREHENGLTGDDSDD